LAKPDIDINAPVDVNGRSTPLHVAAESGRADVGEHLKAIWYASRSMV
jgi:hypothetical protein